MLVIKNPVLLKHRWLITAEIALIGIAALWYAPPSDNFTWVEAIVTIVAVNVGINIWFLSNNGEFKEIAWQKWINKNKELGTWFRASLFNSRKHLVLPVGLNEPVIHTSTICF